MISNNHNRFPKKRYMKVTERIPHLINFIKQLDKMLLTKFNFFYLQLKYENRKFLNLICKIQKAVLNIHASTITKRSLVNYQTVVKITLDFVTSILRIRELQMKQCILRSDRVTMLKSKQKFSNDLS